MTAICGFVRPGIDPTAASELLRRLAEPTSSSSASGMSHTRIHDAGGFAVRARLPDHGRETHPRRYSFQQNDLSVVAAAEVDGSNDLLEPANRESSAGEGPAAVIAALYRRHGPDCVRHLRGAFSFALWDGAAATLLLATDHFGIETMHYAQVGDTFVFGSRLAPILAFPEVPRSIDPEAIYHYLFFSVVPTPHTIYRAIRKLPAGHYLTLSNRRMQLVSYWEVSYPEDLREIDRCAAPIRTHLARAVRAKAEDGRGGTSVGAFLSGGTDSSTITGLLAQSRQSPAKAFSIGFEDDDFDELEYARLVARRFGVEHHEYTVTPNDCLDLLPKLVEAFEEPFGNASAVALYHCARMARQHGIETMLAGDGGDELFAGNTRYVREKIFDLYSRAPGWLRTGCVEPALARLPGRPGGLFEKARKYVRRANLPQPNRFFSYNLFNTIAPESVFSAGFLDTVEADAPWRLARSLYERAPAANSINRLLYVDLRLCITDNDLRKVSRMTELAGVRARYPMLDPDLAEHSGRIPLGLKIRGLRERYIFKRAFAELLPPEVLGKKKHGFGVPVSRWLREEPRMHDLARDVLLSPSAAQRGYLRPGFIDKLFDLHEQDRTNFYGDRLWTFLMLELWHRNESLHLPPG